MEMEKDNYVGKNKHIGIFSRLRGLLSEEVRRGEGRGSFDAAIAQSLTVYFFFYFKVTFW